MKCLLTIAFLSITSSAFAQFELRAGMGIDFLSNPSLNDYINQYYAPSFDQLRSFNSAIVFSAEGGYYLNEAYQLGLEIAYQLNSYTYSDILGRYDFTYGIVMPTIMNYYVFNGEGYNFKFGGGAGLRFVSADETLPGSVSSQNYSSTGFGFILRADGNTLLGSNVYANIGADLKYNLNGELKSGNDYIVNNANDENVNLNSLSAGIRLGITFLF